MALTPEERRRLAQLRAGAAPPREPEPKYSAIADVGRSLKAGVQSIPSATAAFADIPMGLAGLDRPVSRTFGALGEATGFQPKRWAEETSARNAASPELAKQRESVNAIWDKATEDWQQGSPLKAAARVVGGTLINPRATTAMIAESVAPSLVMGGGASLLLKKAVPSLSPIAAGALGQAPVIGGFAMDEIDEAVDPRRAAQAALGTTIAGTAIAGAGGALAYRLGLIDPQTAIAGLGKGMVAKGTKPYGLGKRMLGGALSEGVLQETPQEAIDRIAVNWAEDKPLFEGVPRAAYDGMIAGMGMGALFNVIRPSAVNSVDVTQSSEGTQPEIPEAPSPAGTPPTQNEINSYLKLAMFEQQLPETGAEAYRERAQEQMQRIEEQLVQQGMDPKSLQTEVARKTYEDLQQKLAFAQQQGQEARVANLSRRAQQMENIFGRDVLRGPPLTVVDRLRSLDEQQAQSLFTSEGQLRSFASTEYERIQDMAPATRATYIMAQLEIARADAEQGAVLNRTMPLYQALADEYGLQLPKRRVQSEQTPTDLAGTAYSESAIGLAEQSEQQRMAEVRDFVQRVDAQLRERRQQTEQVEASAPEGPMAEGLRPWVRQREFEAATEQRRDQDYDAALRQAEDQRFQQAEMEAALNEEFEARSAQDTDAQMVIRDRIRSYEERQEMRALRERLANMTDSQFEMFRTDQLGIAPEGRAALPKKKKYPRPAQLNLPGIEKARKRGLEYYDPYAVETYATEIESLFNEMGSFERPALIRDPITNKVVTRTPWVQSEWYKDRPVQGQRVEQFKEAIKNAQEGKPLTLAQRDIIDYLISVIEKEQTAEREAVAEAAAEREAIQAETQAQPAPTVGDNIPFGTDQGTQAAPEGWDVAPEPAPAPEPAATSAPAPEPAATSAPAPEITGAVDAQVPGMRIIRKKDGTPFAKKYAQSRATFLNNRYGEQGFQYEAVQEGTAGWEVRETRVSPDTNLQATPQPVAQSEPAAATEQTTIEDGIIRPETRDAVQEREATQVPVQPRTGTGQEVGQEVRQQGTDQVQEQVREASVAQPELVQPRRRGITRDLDSLLEVLTDPEYLGRFQEQSSLDAIEGLVNALSQSNRAAATLNLADVMRNAYESGAGRISGNITEAGNLRSVIDLIKNYDARVFQDAITEVINDSEVVPVTKTGKKDAKETRFYTDILEAGALDAAAGKLTNIPKDGDQYARARELAKQEKGAVGMTEDEAVAAQLASEQERPNQGATSFNIADYDQSGSYKLAEDGTTISNPLPVGRIKASVSVFRNRLRGSKPTISVFANQADMQAKNPELYQLAKSSSRSADFDTADAVGYSFGGQVVVFSDRVYSTRQLNFVLAHETLGHYGMRSVFGNARMNNLMDKIWHESSETSNLRKYVTQIQESNEKMTRQEAVEEYLSDYAAIVDASIIKRVWDALKRALELIPGVRLSDHTARYMVYQSRRYVRNRTTPASHMFNVENMVNDMRTIESMGDPGMVGRYYIENDSQGHIQHVIWNKVGSRSFDPAEVRGWVDKLKDSGISFAELSKRGLNEIRTMNYNARDNRGYKEFFRIMSSTVNWAISLRTKYNNMMPNLMNPAIEIGDLYTGQGMTAQQLKRTGQMASESTLHFFSKLDETNVIRQRDSSKPLVVMVDGKLQPNKAVINKMMEESRLTPEQFQKGFTYTVTEVQPLSPQRRAELQTEYGMDDTPKKRKSQIRADLESGAELVELERKVDPRPDITEESIEYIGYLEAQKVMAEKAVDLLMANYEAAAGERANVEDVISDAIGRELTVEDKVFLRKIEDNYVALREEGMTYTETGEVAYNIDSISNGEKFMEMFNKALLSKDDFFTKDVEKVETYLRTMPFDDFVNELSTFREHSGGLRFSETNKFIVQHKVSDLAFFEMRKNDAELLAKRTIMGNYIPLGREGRYQVRIQAVDSNGKEVAISQRQRAQMIYMQLDHRGEGERTAQEITDMMKEASKNGDGVFEIEVHKDGSRILQPVTLVARLEAARTKPGIHSDVNLNEVLTTMSRFNIQLTPNERAAITVGLTQQNAKARTRLRREGTPGYDVKNWTKYLSQDLESAASVISRRKHRHLLDQLMDTTHSKSAELWYGSQDKYNRIKAKYESLRNDPNADEHTIAAAKRDYINYHYAFVVKDSQTNGNKFLDRAQMDLSFLEEQTSVEYTDFGSGDLASNVRMATTFAQLGASAATALLNYLAIGTNVLPFLASYNEKNNFGGGFGRDSVTEVFNAKRIGRPGERAFTPFYDALLEGYDKKNPESTAPEHVAALKRMADEGLTYDEAVFLREQIEGGIMQAALFNAMLGSARGRITKGVWQKTAQAWMYMFSHSEQSTRRITGLAAYRLARNRALRAGKDLDIAMKEASDFAVNAINDTVGEYAMFNRPSLFRGGFQQFIFMYKMFPLTSVLLFSQMDKKGRLFMLGMLMLMSGAKGLPLGDDMMDIVDTIAQRLGLGPRGAWKGGAEATVTAAFEELFGTKMTKFMMRGIVNNMLPVNLSDRTSLSNLIPGTGMGLYGADMGREALEIAGPFASFVGDTLGTAGRTLEFGAGVAGIRPATTSFASVVRQSPVTMLRALGDAVVYNQNGSIVNQRGQVISEDMWWGVTMGRLLGFYPSSAVKHYDVIRSMSRLDNFQKEIVAKFRSSWVSARLRGDFEAANAVVEQVRDWNDTSRGTEFEIRNFVPNSMRALKTAKMTATERYKQSSAVAQRQHIDRLMELYGATD